MDAYFNLMTSVIDLWKSWIESTTQLGMGALTATLMPKSRVFVRTLPPPGEQAGGTMELWDVGQAAPLFDMRNLRVFSPEFHLVVDPTIYSGARCQFYFPRGLGVSSIFLAGARCQFYFPRGSQWGWESFSRISRY